MKYLNDFVAYNENIFKKIFKNKEIEQSSDLISEEEYNKVLLTIIEWSDTNKQKIHSFYDKQESFGNIEGSVLTETGKFIKIYYKNDIIIINELSDDYFIIKYVKTKWGISSKIVDETYYYKCDQIDNVIIELKKIFRFK